MTLISIYMVSKQNKQDPVKKDTVITADYILNLYQESKKIKNKKAQREFVKDVKKLIPYIGQDVTLEVYE